VLVIGCVLSVNNWFHIRYYRISYSLIVLIVSNQVLVISFISAVSSLLGFLSNVCNQQFQLYVYGL